MPKYTLSNKKNHKVSRYIGVYNTPLGWISKISINNKVYKYGPYESEIKAAEKYDRMALKYRKEKAYLNILKNPYVSSSKTTIQRNNKKNNSKINKKYTKNSRQIHKRTTFSVVTRNKICSKQRWCCNFCKKLLADVFIVDHMVPLFLGGSNEEYNLQALCPSCDKFKTSYLDYRIIKPLTDKKIITPSDIDKIQQDNYHKLMCTDPKNTNIINNNDTTNINCHQYINNNTNNLTKNKNIELDINGVKINITIS